MSGARRSFKSDQSIVASAVSGWLRLQASSASGGEYTDWVDVLNTTNPGAINSARRPAVAAAANGLPMASFVTNDCVAWTIAASNYNRDTWGIYIDVAPTATSGVQVLWCVANGSGAANHRAIVTYFSGTNWVIDCYIDDTNGRQFVVASGAVAGTKRRYGIEYDSSIGGDGCMTVTLNGAIQAPSVANLSAGGTLGQLQAVTGNILFGNFVNAAAPSSALTGVVGPNGFALTGKMAGATTGLLTTAARAALVAFEVPT